MGGRGQVSMSGGLNASDDGDEDVDFARKNNFEVNTRVFNAKGIEVRNAEERARTNSAFARFIATNKPEPGDVLYIPVESDPNGGSYR